MNTATNRIENINYMCLNRKVTGLKEHKLDLKPTASTEPFLWLVNKDVTIKLFDEFFAQGFSYCIVPVGHVNGKQSTLIGNFDGSYSLCAMNNGRMTYYETLNGRYNIYKDESLGAVLLERDF